MTNNNLISSVLSTWIALEVLSPANTFKTPEDIGRSAQGKTIRLPAHLPWPTSGPATKNEDYNFGSHIVVLGTLDAAIAYKEIFKTFPNEDLNIRLSSGIIPIALLTVDHQGSLNSAVEPTISSFAWGVPLALRKDLKSLDTWSDAEAEMLKHLAEILAANDGILTQETISKALAFLLGRLNIPPQMCRPDMFIVSYPFSPLWKDRRKPLPDQHPPTPILLNSFFLSDLIGLKKRQIRQMPVNVTRFIEGLHPSVKSTDFTASRKAVQSHFQPNHIPHARWPAGPGRGLVTMQQLAANCIITHDDPASRAGETIVAVNGPPGTGKTTLFLDVIADIVCSRASVMAGIEDPAGAFGGAPHRWTQNGYVSNITPIPPTLTGYEIVVASSNNGAVENITKELPGINAIPEGNRLRYYARTGTLLAKTEAWGMIAAALGNMANCKAFTETVWWNPDWSMRQALNGAAGRAKMVSEKDAKGAASERLPYILQGEDVAANPSEAKVQWQQARARFKTVKAALAHRLEAISDMESLKTTIPKQETALRNENAVLEAASRNLRAAQGALEKIHGERLQLMVVRGRAQERLDALKLIAPGFLKRILKRAAAKRFDNEMAVAVAEFTQASRNADTYDQKAISCDASVDAARRQQTLVQTSISSLKINIEQSKGRLATLRKELVGVPLDGEFLNASHGEFHSKTPWLDDQTNRLREDLFAAAMDVHRTFCQSAAKVLLPNLKAACEVMMNQRPPTDTQEIVRIAWQTLFLVCPVISTAFASVSRLFAHVPDGTFGHLLIDEAGQASPQYAVGAMTRAKSVYIVGDPLQIEPVVTLPEAIGVQVARACSLEMPQTYLAPRASVQTLGDRASAFRGSFDAEVGTRTVGVPLVVHRRCSEPMFSIANQVAYSGTMVSLKKPQPSPVKAVLGESQWIDVSGISGTWIPEEGTVVVHILKRLQRTGADLDLYVLSPFREVAHGLRTTIRQELSGLVPDEALNKFLKERVGTVHTAQGKEADAVIFVLGAAGRDAAGSRNWAGSAPNLLNVAVTRAKEAIYVVGDYSGWSSAGHFKVLAGSLQRGEPALFFR